VAAEPEVNVMIILLAVVATAIVGLPLAAVVLVTVATRREETARSIAGRAPGPLARAARRVLAFHAVGITRPACRSGAPSVRRDRQAGNLTEDGLAPADDLALAGGGRPLS
jgi:hypothetical protein